MIKYKGTTLYPPAMHDVLSHFDSVENHVIEISTNDLGTDEIVIKIASEKASDELLSEIKDYFRAKLRVTPKIEFAPIEELNKVVFPAISRKPIRFFDLR